MKKTTLTLAGATLVALLLQPSDDAFARKKKEKCYGVSKAGKNDCAAHGHSCAGQASIDGDSSEWLYVKKGLCKRIVGGSTKSRK